MNESHIFRNTKAIDQLKNPKGDIHKLRQSTKRRLFRDIKSTNK
jgi:hypothetical protein